MGRKGRVRSVVVGEGNEYNQIFQLIKEGKREIENSCLSVERCING